MGALEYKKTTKKLLIFSNIHAQPSPGFIENGQGNQKMHVSDNSVGRPPILMTGRKRVSKLVQYNRKVTIALITLFITEAYRIATERTKCRALKQMGYSRRKHTVCHSCQIKQETETTIR